MQKIQPMPTALDTHHATIGGFGEERVFAVRGRWRDQIIRHDGVAEWTEWSPNQIQNVAPIVAASLFRRYSAVPAGAGWDGITFMGFGSGDVSWDATPPTQDPADTTLTTEYFRKAINATDMAFSDGAGSALGSGESRYILITVQLLPAEGNGTLREFGLFGGDATIALDSGKIINWVVHPRIDKDASLTINRQVEIEFLEP